MLIRALTYREEPLASVTAKAISGGQTGVVHMNQMPAMPQTEVEIVNKLGLHARASAKLTQLASGFQSEIWLTRNSRRVNAKSIMGVMMLAAGKGAKIGIEISGKRRRRGIAGAAETDSRKIRGRRVSFTLHGSGAGGGIAIGQVHLISSARLEVAHYEVNPADLELEVMRFSVAVDKVRFELQALAPQRTCRCAAAELDAFLNLHLMILDDTTLSYAPRDLIRSLHCNAEWALVQQMDYLVAQIRQDRKTPTCARERRTWSRWWSACSRPMQTQAQPRQAARPPTRPA